MAVLTGSGGVFTGGNIATVNSALSVVTPDFYIDSQEGFNGNDGLTPETAVTTMSALTLKLLELRRTTNRQLVVSLSGVLSEEYTSPLGLSNVSIIGSQAIPRQATTSGVPNGAGATWLSPTGGTSWLIRVRAQGWVLQNIYFNNSATAAPCISILTDGAGDPPTDADGAHLLISDCILTGTDDGINVNGGTNFIRVVNTTLFGFSGAGDLAVSSTAGAGIGTLLDWRFINCKFFNNAGNITAGLSHATITGCQFENGSASNINLTGGTAPNFVVGNYFNIAAADFDPAGGTTGVSGDVWSNTLTDAIETGLPAN